MKVRRFPSVWAGGLWLVLMFVAGWVPGAGAAVFTIADDNSVAVVDSAGGIGMRDWRIDGVDHLQQQWFWYRVGQTGPESPIDALPLERAGVSDTDFDGTPETLYLRYGTPQLRVEVTFLLTGGAAGSGISDIAESIALTNLGTAPLDIHFYQYCNLHLNGSPENDAVQILTGNRAVQAFGARTASETVHTPAASHCQVSLAPATLASLQDGLPTTLSDASGPLGPGDLSWAFQWDTTIAPGKNYLISKDKQIVPEPATVSLLALGAAAIRRRKR